MMAILLAVILGFQWVLIHSTTCYSSLHYILLMETSRDNAYYNGNGFDLTRFDWRVFSWASNTPIQRMAYLLTHLFASYNVSMRKHVNLYFVSICTSVKCRTLKESMAFVVQSLSVFACASMASLQKTV